MSQVHPRQLDSVFDNLFEELQRLGKDSGKIPVSNRSCKPNDTVYRNSSKPSDTVYRNSSKPSDTVYRNSSKPSDKVYQNSSKFNDTVCQNSSAVHNGKNRSDIFSFRKESSEILGNKDFVTPNMQDIVTNKRNDLVLSSNRYKVIPRNIELSNIDCYKKESECNDKQIAQNTKHVKNFKVSDYNIPFITYADAAVDQMMKEPDEKKPQNDLMFPWQQCAVDESARNLIQKGQNMQHQGYIDLKPSMRKKSTGSFICTQNGKLKPRNNTGEDERKDGVDSVMYIHDNTCTLDCYRQKDQFVVTKDNIKKQPEFDLQPSFRRSITCTAERKKLRRSSNIDTETSSGNDDCKRVVYDSADIPGDYNSNIPNDMRRLDNECINDIQNKDNTGKQLNRCSRTMESIDIIERKCDNSSTIKAKVKRDYIECEKKDMINSVHCNLNYPSQDKRINTYRLTSKTVDGDNQQQTEPSKSICCDRNGSLRSQIKNTNKDKACIETCDPTCKVHKTSNDQCINILFQADIPNPVNYVSDSNRCKDEFCTNPEQRHKVSQNDIKYPAPTFRKGSKRKRHESISDTSIEIAKKLRKGKQPCFMSNQFDKLDKLKKGLKVNQNHSMGKYREGFALNKQQFIHRIHKTIAESDDLGTKELNDTNDNDDSDKLEVDRITELENIIPLSAMTNEHIRKARVRLERQKGTLNRLVTKDAIWTTVNSKY